MNTLITLGIPPFAIMLLCAFGCTGVLTLIVLLAKRTPRPYNCIHCQDTLRIEHPITHILEPCPICCAIKPKCRAKDPIACSYYNPIKGCLYDNDDYKRCIHYK